MTDTPIYEKLYALQEAYNAHTNITRINSKAEFYTKHIQDSLVLLNYIKQDNPKIIDIGTGGGYPGIPLAIELPNASIVLNDSVQKKVKYLHEVKEKLPLSNIQPIWARAEDLAGDGGYREKFDYATARAVAEIRILLEYLSPFVKVGGKLLLMKAKTAEKEVNEAKNAEKKLYLSLSGIDTFTIGDMERAIIVYTKIAPSPKNYPRKPGTAEKNPL